VRKEERVVMQATLTPDDEEEYDEEEYGEEENVEKENYEQENVEENVERENDEEGGDEEEYDEENVEKEKYEQENAKENVERENAEEGSDEEEDDEEENDEYHDEGLTPEEYRDYRARFSLWPRRKDQYADEEISETDSEPEEHPDAASVESDFDIDDESDSSENNIPDTGECEYEEMITEPSKTLSSHQFPAVEDGEEELDTVESMDIEEQEEVNEDDLGSCLTPRSLCQQSFYESPDVTDVGPRTTPEKTYGDTYHVGRSLEVTAIIEKVRETSFSEDDDEITPATCLIDVHEQTNENLKGTLMLIPKRPPQKNNGQVEITEVKDTTPVLDEEMLSDTGRRLTHEETLPSAATVPEAKRKRLCTPGMDFSEDEDLHTTSANGPRILAEQPHRSKKRHQTELVERSSSLEREFLERHDGIKKRRKEEKLNKGRQGNLTTKRRGAVVYDKG
jgi:hypothetical protein